MKKIFMVLFLILAVSIPAFAKKTQMEEDWVNFMTAKDGTEWYYDVNSVYINRFPSKGWTGLYVKSYNPLTSKTEKYAYSFKCTFDGGYARKNATTKKLSMTANYKDYYTVKEGEISWYLHNDFCKGRK